MRRGGGGDGKKRGMDAVEGAGDGDDRRRLSDLIDVATNSPLLQLDDRSLTSIKAVVRRSDANVRVAFDLLYDKLKKNHSQVRDPISPNLSALRNHRSSGPSLIHFPSHEISN